VERGSCPIAAVCTVVEIYTVSQKKAPTLKHYRSKVQGSIFMTFGTNIQNTLQYSPYPSVFV